jgi:hypothetical protein
MNTTGTGASRPSPQPQGSDRSARHEPARERQRGEDFERLLREKAARHEEEELSDSASGTGDAPVMPSFVSWAMPPLPQQRQGGEGPADGAAAGAQDGAARSAMPSGADAEPPAPLAAASNTAGAWELTLRQPLSAPLDLRASRNAEAVNGWSLTIGSPTVDASVLARHAPRLNERLKARALSNTHVRIEERDEEERS